MSHLGYLVDKAVVEYTAPSNIAFVKYWGKTGKQIPQNASISMTLSKCVSQTKITFIKSDQFSLKKFFFEGKLNESFRVKAEKFLLSILDEINFLKSYELTIDSSNSFPHSSGIASSASGFAAISMILLHVEAKILGTQGLDMEKASHIARLGSGSACRSIYSGFAHWGESFLERSSNKFATEVDYDFNFRNCIAIVNKEEKSVSSSVGHVLMETNPFAETRYLEAKKNMESIIQALKDKDFESFGQILEKEALSLHALMMMSDPSFVLLEPNSIAIIKAVKEFRKKHGNKVYFTIDAGPNIHLIYQGKDTAEVESFIRESLGDYTSNLIWDRKGSGPCLIMEEYEFDGN